MPVAAAACRVQAPSTRHPLRHPTGDKVSLLIELLSSLLDGKSASCDAGTTHLLWIDGDAVVLRHERRVEEILALAPPTAELVVGEDVTQCCLVNAGVLLVRVSEWSLALWRDVWEAPSSEKFDTLLTNGVHVTVLDRTARQRGWGCYRPQLLLALSPYGAHSRQAVSYCCHSPWQSSALS